MTVDNNAHSMLSTVEVKETAMAPPWAISRRIQPQSGDVLRVGQGSLYPALYRLEARGLIQSEWGISDEGRRAKFYTLGASGRRELARQADAWRTYSGAVNLVLQGAGAR